MKIRFVANMHAVGGGEMSARWLMETLAGQGHTVLFHPVKGISSAWAPLRGVSVRESLGQVDATDCDLLVFYANDAAYGIQANEDRWKRLLAGAARRVAVLNFVIGQAKEPWFRDALDMAITLNTTKLEEFRGHGYRGAGLVLAPPVDIRPFLGLSLDYDGPMRVVRHSRYGQKYDEADFLDILTRARQQAPDATWTFMACPPFLKNKKIPGVAGHPWDGVPVTRLLAEGNVFWYRLPASLKDQGPRVVVEAMAAGLPCIVDARDGCADRVTDAAGWLCSSAADHVEALRQAGDPAIRRAKGLAARERAVRLFDPFRWIEALAGASAAESAKL